MRAEPGKAGSSRLDRLRGWPAYVIAVAATACVFALRLALTPVFGEQPTLEIFTIAIMTSAYLGGFGPGVLATSLSCLGGAYFLLPVLQESAADQVADRWQMILIGFAGLVISLGADALHRSRRRADAAIAARIQGERDRAHLAAIVQASDDAIASKDLRGIITSWNPGAEKVFGYTAAEAVGRPMLMVIPPELAHQEATILAHIARGEAVPSFEAERLRKDGERICVSAQVSPIRNAAGIVIGASTVARDITKQRAAERLQRETEARYASAFRSSPAPIVILRRSDLMNLDVNDAALRLFECSREEIVGRRLFEMTLLEKDTVVTLREQLTAQGGFDNVEVPAQTSAGRPLYLNLSLRIIELQGEPCSLATLIDITERKRAEEALRNQQALFRETGHIAKVGGWEFNPATGESMWTDEVALIHDLAPGEPADVSRGMDYYHGESRTRIAAAVKAAVEQGIPYDLELELTSARGVRKWVRTIGHPIRRHGRTTLVRGSFQDITERKRAELRAAAQHAATAVLSEAGPFAATARRLLEIISRGLDWKLGALWTIDRNTQRLRCVDLWHPASTEFKPFAAMTRSLTFGPGEGLPGRVWREGAPVWLTDMGAERNFPRQVPAAALGLKTAVAFPIRLRDEVYGIIEVFSPEPREPDEDLLALFGSLGTQFGQFVERQQLEEQYRQAQKMEAIGTLAGGIAHDFNNVLAAISGYAELAKLRVADQPTTMEYLQAISDGSTRAAKLVRQILAFSRLEEQERRPMKPAQIIDEAVKLLRATIPATVEFEVALDAKLPLILADPTQVHQVIMNLATNAAHAMRDRPGRLGITAQPIEVDAGFAAMHAGLKPGRYVRVGVSDNGHGMDAATLRRIFDPFFTTKAIGEGTGLGLAVVHGIMRNHDGAITVYSQPGKGTQFQLYFPAHTDGTLEVVPSAHTPRGHGQRILFVDDEAPLATMGRKSLEVLGYRVDAHTSPAEALVAFQKEPAAFDLVFTDLTMAGLTGLDLAREVLTLRPEIPVILVTGYNAGLTQDKARAAGIRDMLLKPLTMHELGQAVHRALNL